MPATTLNQIAIPELEAGWVLTAESVDGDEPLMLTVVDKLGEGATGIAYRVTTPKFGYELVVKVPREMRVGMRLLVEARWTPRPSTQHYCYEFMGVRPVQIPNMAPGDVKVPVIVTKFYSGGTVGAYLGFVKKCPRPLAMRWAVQIATALREARVLHRDIKPDNIFLDAQQNAFLGDYGLAIPDTPEERTKCGISIDPWLTGTPEYMSPEALVRPQAIDFRTDLYALGLVLYEMTTGSPGRVDRPEEEHLDIERYITELRQVGFAIPLDQVSDPITRKIISNCTAVRMVDRYKSWDHFIADAVQHASFNQV